MTYTFSDGLTLAGSNVTNDLVTGAEVAHLDVQTASGSLLGISDAGQMDLSTIAGQNLVLAAGQDELHTVGRDETHTIGRNFSLSADGATGVTIAATTGNLVLAAGTGDAAGEVRISPTGAAPAAGLTFRIWDGAGAGQVTIDTGISDSATLGQLLDALFAWGWITNPTP